MTIWDFLHNHIPLWFVTPAFILAAVGFCGRGLLFFRFGFGKLPDIPLDVVTKADIQNMATKADIERIETNHFAHLNRFLDLLCGILQDKGILTGAESAQLKQTLKD
ncbi:hypothetical protein AGMMS49942_00490 [Spirochaetia bacterium]|nr:hypothetical protein AGMMS49942_00490 [Spirochaetia bacterium]